MPEPKPRSLSGSRRTDTHEKAFQINLDNSKYGAFAEIGAGQEVVRWFFQAGGAAGTIAKSMSAYDMTVSDAIYGPCARYVSRERLQTMLDHEFDLLQERLDPQRGDRTEFFAFADTVAAQSFQGNADCHGWMGIRFQTFPRTEPSQIVLHVRMLDRGNVAQQEALGIVGVNLIHGALYHHDDPDAILNSLLDSLTSDRIEVDMIKFTGPAFPDVDHRLVALKLVQLEL
ncbi:MAG: TonB-dependent receptor, partial [Armatimonadaceae bacterium]